MYKLISYIGTVDDSAWPNAPTLKLTPFEEIERGDACNTFKIEIFNHFGSHMDAPRHFNDAGKTISDFPIDSFIYTKPLLVDIPKTFGELLTKKDLEPFARDLANADILLVRSGFSQYRKADQKRYSFEGPGVSSEAAGFLVAECPNLKAIAVDWISLASYKNVEDGIEAHRRLLGYYGNKHIFIMEDICLDGLENCEIMKIIALPLFIKGVDSAPVTVVAELEK